jgi:hypothetical protein
LTYPTPDIRRQRATRLVALGLLLAVAVFGPRVAGASLLPAHIAGWILLLLLPGYALYRWTGGAHPVHGALFATLVSPVIVSLLAIAAIAGGASLPLAGAVLMTAAVVAGMRRGARDGGSVPRRELWMLAGIVGLAAFFTGILPMTSELWRIRSDAWFHGAVVEQIRTYHLPPDDPYFVGLPLQYMWFYHAFVLLVSDTLRMDPFRVMAVINIQAVTGRGAAAGSLAAVFRQRTAHRLAATASLLFCFNAAFWILLPIKAVRAMIGDVRGFDEIARTFSLVPFDYGTACGFMTIYYNQEFFLDKFMVATAFGFALTAMTGGWFAFSEWMANGTRRALVLLAFMLVGMLGFHSLVGFVMLVGICGGVILAHLFPGAVGRPPLLRSATLLAVSLGCFLLTTPYLYLVMHMKEREQVIPLSVSFPKTAGIFIASLFVMVLAARQRWFTTERTPAARVFALAAIAVLVFCLAIRLPGPNTYDKLGYFVFLPFSIVAGFAMADITLRRTGRARAWTMAAWIGLFAVPAHALAFAAAFNTPTPPLVEPAERDLSAWVREHTDRDAVFIDDHDRTFLLVTGPRRYLFGNWPYAQQWGYPRLEMARRLHAVRVLYNRPDVDATTLEVLTGRAEPLYVVVRPEHHARGAAVLARPDLFAPVYEGRDLALYRVDTAACRAALEHVTERTSPEEMIRESGL